MARKLYKKKGKTSWPKIEKEWNTYKQKTKGVSRMKKGQWLKFNHPEYYKTTRTKYVERGLKKSGLTPAEIRRLKRGKR
jgi:hypothetical protein